MMRSAILRMVALVLATSVLSGGGTVLAESPNADETQRIIELLRTKGTRALTVEDRRQLDEEIKLRPQIDFEVHFEFNSSALTKTGRQWVDVLGEVLRKPEFKDYTLLLIGHADARGSDGYNLWLSERRADAVRRVLMEKFGIAAEKLVAVGFGKQRLKNPGDPYGSENRRLQVVSLAPR
jgi:outer membrane protein OmpA-like peptidoglycan-associated protein